MRELKNGEKEVKKEKLTFYKKHPTKFKAFVEKARKRKGWVWVEYTIYLTRAFLLIFLIVISSLFLFK